MPANKKCPVPDHTSPPKSSSTKKQKKKPKPKPADCCPVCENIIAEEDEEQGVTGDDALFCEGQCTTWIHRICLGLNKKLYEVLTEADDPYFCPHCLLDKQAHELDDLRQQVKTLTDDLAQIKNQLPVLKQTQSLASHDVDATGNTPLDTDAHVQTKTSILPTSSVRHQHTPTSGVDASPQNDRKFNTIIYGIPECLKGTKKSDRTKCDLTNVISAVSPVDNDITSHSIRDCFRLGRYQEHADRPHPILIKFTRAIDAASLLSKRSSLPDKIFIKPDMSQAERFIESLLLKERWCLIQSGTNRKSIRIQSTNIYVDDKLHGKVHNSSFELVSTSPSPPSISDSFSSSPMVTDDQSG